MWEILNPASIQEIKGAELRKTSGWLVSLKEERENRGRCGKTEDGRTDVQGWDRACYNK